MTPQSIVIVGTGHAGLRAAQTLRHQGWSGDLTLIGQEPLAPYDRTAVSKGMLFGRADPVWLDAVDADLRLGSLVTAVDRAARRVVTPTGDIGYDHLILATGAQPRRLALAAGLPHVYALRHARDAAALREEVRSGARMLVIGGGLIGLEVASGAVQAGVQVTVLEVLPRLMSRVLPEVVAARLCSEHRNAGVDVRTSTRLVSLELSGDQLLARLDSGDDLLVDVVVVAIGIVPDTDLAAAAGLRVGDGISVDDRLITSDLAISAVGDVASVTLSAMGPALRCESQQLAEEQGRYAARRILGEQQAFATVPWAWSDQYDKVVQIAGLPAMASQMVLRDFAGEGIVACHLSDDGHLVGASGFGLPQRIAQEVGAARRLIARCAQPSIEQLANPGAPLRALV